MLSAFLFILFITMGYLVGSVCSAVIVSKLFDLPDPCSEGSKNPGATNVLRLAGKKYAVYVLVADMLKGFFPVLLAALLTSNHTLAAFTCLAAVIGHCYPLFFKFKGGKGIATAFGGLLGLNLVLGASVVGIWLLVVNFSRYSSLASMISMAFMPVLAIIFLQSGEPLIPMVAISLLVFYKHRYNINRLIDGTEPKVFLKKPILHGEGEHSTVDAAEEGEPQPVETITDIVEEDTQNKTTNEGS